MIQQTMEHKSINIDLIKPDPKQPRRVFDDETLQSLAISIRNEGIINSIEVDENYIIITGEQRWKAAKIAGLTEVPVKVVPGLDEKSRFIRQVQENINSDTMTPYDTALAMKKVANWLPKREKLTNARQTYEENLTELHNLFGRSEDTIRRYLDILGETGEMKKALKTKGFKITKIRLLKKVNPKYQEEIRNIVATQADLGVDTVNHIILAVNRAAKYEEDESIQKLLKQDFKNLTSYEALAKINKIIETEEERIKGPAEATKKTSAKIIELMELLEKFPLKSFDSMHGSLIQKDINNLGFFLGKYLKGEERIQKIKRTLLKNKQ